MCLVINNVKKGLTIYNSQLAGTIPARLSWPVYLVGKTREPREKIPQACMEQANCVDITKHKCRDIGLPAGVRVPNRQVAQGEGSTGTSLSGQCAIASQT